MAAERDAAALDQVSYWDSGAPGYRWNEIAVAQGLKDGIALAAYRVLALVNVAIYDATIAAWDAKYVYNRPRPSEAEPSLTTVRPRRFSATCSRGTPSPSSTKRRWQASHASWLACSIPATSRLASRSGKPSPRG
jgi:hypothetical protein